MNNFHRIIWYHKCVCRILLRKSKKYSKYTMKTCRQNLLHIYMMCYFNLVIGWRMQGWLKGQSHILKTAIMVPRKRLSRAIAATFWPRGPECKKNIFSRTLTYLVYTTNMRRKTISLLFLKNVIIVWIYMRFIVNTETRKLWFGMYNSMGNTRMRIKAHSKPLKCDCSIINDTTLCIESGDYSTSTVVIARELQNA